MWYKIWRAIVQQNKIRRAKNSENNPQNSREVEDKWKADNQKEKSDDEEIAIILDAVVAESSTSQESKDPIAQESSTLTTYTRLTTTPKSQDIE